jgi:Glycosyl transferases group 1
LKRIAFTICNYGYLHYALECEASFVSNHSSDWRFIIVLVDYPSLSADHLASLQGLLAAPSSAMVAIPEIFKHSREVSAMSLYYDITEYSTSVKPWVFSYLFNEYSPLSATYIDPDIQFFGSLEPHELVGKEKGWDCVVTPHILSDSLNAIQNPTLHNIRACGSYNFGFVHFENTIRSGKVIDFWKRQLVYDSLNWLEENLFTDQRFGDLFPSMCRVRVNRSPALNIAYWNMQERLLYIHSNGRPHVRLLGDAQDDGSVVDCPLVFFHFSGLRVSGSIGISKYGGRDPRSPRGGNKTIERLAARYEARTSSHRRHLSDLNLDVPADLIGSLRYESSNQSQYYQLRPQERRDLNRFLAGRANAGMAMLPPSRFEDEDTFLRALLGISSQSRSGVMHSESNVLGAIGLHLPDIGLIESAALRFGEASPVQLNVIGYPNFSFGVGRITGLILRGLSDSGIRFSFTIDPAKVMPVLDSDLDWVQSLDGLCPFSSNAPSLFLVNADQLLHYANTGIADQYFSRVCNLGYWWWELESPVPAHAEAAKYLDRVLAPTQFIYDSLARLLPRQKLIYAPLDYRKLYDSIASASNAHGFKDSDQDFLFSLGLELDIERFKSIALSVFDFRSCVERKNPLLLIDLFSEPGMEDQALILKCSAGASFADQYLYLIERIASLPNVFLLNASLPQADLQRLFLVCQVYASPHRSEGLGLNIIEADAYGLATVFTDYGGITDYPFFGPGPHHPCPFSLVEMGKGSVIYQSHLATLATAVNWAEPDRQAFQQALRESLQAVALSVRTPAVSRHFRQPLSLIAILKELLKTHADGRALYQPREPMVQHRSPAALAVVPTLGDAKRQLYLACRQLLLTLRNFMGAFRHLLNVVKLIAWLILRQRRGIRRLYHALTVRLHYLRRPPSFRKLDTPPVSSRLG